MYSVIFVDDEPWGVVDAMNSVDWPRYHFQVVAYLSDPLQALDEAARLRPDVIVVDIRMPGMDGFAFIEQCLRRGVESRFVILSGYSDFDYTRRALHLPVEDYWLKPLDPACVHEALQKLEERLNAEGAPGHLTPNDAHFESLLQYVRCHAGSKLLLEDVAVAFGYNRNYLCTLFKRQTGLSFVQYLTDVRVKMCCELLRTTNLNLDAIAQQCGLGDGVYLTKVFRKHMHVTPAAYRRAAAERKRP